MCAKGCSRKIKQYTKCIKNIFERILIFFLNSILKVTLCELLWICTVLSFLILCWTYHMHTFKINRVLKNPVILWWTSGFPGTFETRHCHNNLICDIYNERNRTSYHEVGAYLFYASNIDFENLPLPRRPAEIIWGLYHEESPRNVEELLHEQTLKLFNFSSTFSRYSDVPFPLQYLESVDDITSTAYYVPTSKKDALTQIAPVLYLQTDCETTTERDNYVQELMKFIDIDSYGDCLNNREQLQELKDDYLNKLNDDVFLQFIARYKFVIAIENGVCNDYVTEKFWRAIKVGSVPIYFGSPTIRDWLPNNQSAILLADYPEPKIMAKYLKELMNNKSLYELHLEHKTKNIVTNERLLNELKTRPFQTDSLKVVETFECYICKKLYERRSKKLKENVISKDHYNCPMPISALTLNVRPENSWVYSWKLAKGKAEAIYKRVIGN